MTDKVNGRPPLVTGDTSKPVNVRVSTSQYERAAAKVARERSGSVPALMRRALDKLLDDDDD